jgi:hypothetical protein
LKTRRFFFVKRATRFKFICAVFYNIGITSDYFRQNYLLF